MGSGRLPALLAMDREHERPVGARNAFSRRVMELVQRAGDEVREEISSSEAVREYVESLREGVRLRDRTCMNLYGQILKLGNDEKHVIVHVLNQMGVQTLDELSMLVEQSKGAQRVTPEQRAAVCLEYLELYLNTHPRERIGAIKRLGGEVVVRSDSYAVVGNGVAPGQGAGEGAGE